MRAEDKRVAIVRVLHSKWAARIYQASIFPIFMGAVTTAVFATSVHDSQVAQVIVSSGQLLSSTYFIGHRAKGQSNRIALCRGLD